MIRFDLILGFFFQFLFIAHHYYVMKVNLIIFNIQQSSSIYQPLTKQSLRATLVADTIFMH